MFSLSVPCYIEEIRKTQYCSVTYKILRRTLKQWKPNAILLLKIFINCIPKTQFASTKKKKKPNFCVITYIYMGIECDY